MKALTLCAIILSMSITLIGCSTPLMPSTDLAHPTLGSPKPAYPVRKDPAEIVFINRQDIPPNQYTVIGEATVSKYNVAGIKRQKAVIQDRLRELASSMGGEAIIHLQSDDSYVTGIVVISQKPKPA